MSSIIRGEQIAERLGARLNPANGYERDVCVYVKPHIKPGHPFNFGGSPYLDIIDAWALAGVALKYPQVGVIACSEQDGQLLKLAVPNRVTVIPQHHANFERLPRTREGVTRVGVIGALPAFDFLPKGLGQALAERGIELELFSKFYTRADIVAFYQRIDVQIVWRPYRMRLSNPLKIVNAAAFGVPTIALRESVFDEVQDFYFDAANVEELLEELDSLRTYANFQEIANGLQASSERYHIDAVCEMYRRLT